MSTESIGLVVAATLIIVGMALFGQAAIPNRDKHGVPEAVGVVTWAGLAMAFWGFIIWLAMVSA